MNKKKIKIGIVISNFLSINILKKKFKNKNVQIIYNKTKRKPNESYIIKNFKECEIIVSGTEKYTKKTLDDFKNLRHIIRIGVGVENLDLEFLKHNKVSVHTTDSLLANSVAELIVQHILFLSRNFFEIYQETKPKWVRSYGNLIHKKKIGIIGYGRIGRKLAQIIKSFEPENIYIYDNNLRKNVYFPKNYKLINNLKLLFKYSDIISINLPLTKSTKFLINKEILNNAKKKLILINTSRAEIINKKDLLEFLKSNKEVKVGLDVFYDEPSYKPFLKYKNLSYSSHIGSYTFESRTNMELKAIYIISNLIK